MKNKYLYAALFFCGIVFLAAITAGLYLHYSDGRNVRGQYTFAQTRNNLNRLARIQLLTAESGEINIVRDGNIWKFKEAKNYFANVEMLSLFYKMVTNSIILSVQDKNAETYGLQTDEKTGAPLSGTQIKTYDDEGKILDNLWLADIVDADGYRFVRVPHRAYVYVADATSGFSGQAEAWLPYPLLSITTNIVEAFDWKGEFYNRHYYELLLQHSEKARQVMRVLQYIEYQGLVTVEDFVQAYPHARAQKINVITIAGLVYEMFLYHVEDGYWLRINLKSTKVPHKDVPEFIQNNRKYFNQWIFQLTDEQGKLLYRTKLPTVERKS